MNGRRGSILLMALWIIAVLSIMVLSFASEAHLQTGINVYVRERNRVNRLTEAGQALAEVVLLGYRDAKEWSESEDVAELLEEDRWYKEKRDLKNDSKCVIGPILLDEDHVDSGTVTIEIEVANGGEKNGLNINELYSGADQNYRLRWEMMLQSHGIPEELATEKEGTIKLWDILISSWNDWRDEDDLVTAAEDGTEAGAENAWYEDYEEKNRIEDEDKKRPRQGRIPDIQELGYVRGFRDYPQVLTGGVINPWERGDDQITVRGIVDLLGVSGSAKVNVNSCTVDQLLTVPGIFDEDDEEAGTIIAQAIIDGLKVMPEYDVDPDRTWWPYKDWNDLTQRIDEEIPSEANQYLMFTPDENAVFKIKITGESMGMTHSVYAQGYVKDKKVRYIEWRED